MVQTKKKEKKTKHQHLREPMSAMDVGNEQLRFLKIALIILLVVVSIPIFSNIISEDEVVGKSFVVITENYTDTNITDDDINSDSHTLSDITKS